MNFNLLLGDCLERMAELAPASIDMVLTDLPYGTTANRWDTVIPMDSLWEAWKRVCRKGAPIVLFTQQPFTTIVASSNLKQLRTEWIWEKARATGFLNSKRYSLKAHENVLVFCDCTPPYLPQMETGAKPYQAKAADRQTTSNYRQIKTLGTVNDGTRYPRSVLRFVSDTGLHPTQKPAALCEYLVRTYTQPGATVLDCTMGSGSTGVAALRAGRCFVGIERDEAYFDIAGQRIGALGGGIA